MHICQNTFGCVVVVFVHVHKSVSHLLLLPQFHPTRRRLEKVSYSILLSPFGRVAWSGISLAMHCIASVMDSSFLVTTTAQHWHCDTHGLERNLNHRHGTSVNMICIRGYEAVHDIGGHNICSIPFLVTGFLGGCWFRVSAAESCTE